MQHKVSLEEAKKLIQFYPNWPKEGVNFVDLLPLLSDADTFGVIIEELGKHLTTPNVAAPEARGFLFAAPLLVTGSSLSAKMASCLPTMAICRRWQL